MKLKLLLFSVFIFYVTTIISQENFKKYNPKEITVSAEEFKLYNKINEYRKSKKLYPIPLSKALCHVAQLHSKDLEIKLKRLTHGWSTCNYSDNKSKTYPCMWGKPSELTSYKSTGFECAHGGEGNYIATAESSLTGWQKSKHHNDVILNKDIWKNSNWNAIGVGIYGGYATIWFGEEKDIDGSPKNSK